MAGPSCDLPMRTLKDSLVKRRLYMTAEDVCRILCRASTPRDHGYASLVARVR